MPFRATTSPRHQAGLVPNPPAVQLRDAERRVADGCRRDRLAGRPAADRRRRPERALTHRQPARRPTSVASSPRCGCTGIRFWSTRRRRRRSRSTRHRPRRSRRFGGEAFPPRRPRTAQSRSDTTTTACRPGRRGRRCRGEYTRFGDVVPLLSAIDDQFVVSAPGDEMALSFDGTIAAAAAGRLDAYVSPLRRRLQQGDEPALVEPGSPRAAAVPRHEPVSVPAARTLSRDAAHDRYRAHLQHAASSAAPDPDHAVSPHPF